MGDGLVDLATEIASRTSAAPLTGPDSGAQLKSTQLDGDWPRIQGVVETSTWSPTLEKMWSSDGLKEPATPTHASGIQAEQHTPVAVGEFLPTNLDKNQRFAKLLKVLLKMTPAISNKD